VTQPISESGGSESLNALRFLTVAALSRAIAASASARFATADRRR